MGRRLLHIMLCLLMTGAFQVLVSCIYDNGMDDDDGNGANGATAMFVLQTSTVDGSRAGGAGVEGIHSLRVIILNQDGSLEENFFVDNLGGKDEYIHTFKVSRNETKTIYLIANEKSLNLEGTGLNNLGDKPAETIEVIEFSLDEKRPIPMSACYTITVGNEKHIEKTMCLVRAATKFTFTFENGRHDAVTIHKLEAEKFADRMYLMPHFKEGETLISSENFFVDDKGTYSSADSKQFWIEWLEEAVRKSGTGDYEPDDIGWISAYSLPLPGNHNQNICFGTDNTENGIATIQPGETYEYPEAFYRSESAYIPDGKESQEYSISYLKVHASTGFKEFSYSDPNFVDALRISNVKHLFRNTHVKVNIVFSSKDLYVFARIHPWKLTTPSDPIPLEPEN